ncbi:MAG: hypothetical protein U9Q68_04115 [Euryarchaeota archaeon]|nr:hypothetical protein [Euryarchaeota archaeon]
MRIREDLEKEDSYFIGSDVVRKNYRVCLAEVEKPRDYTRLTSKYCGNQCNLVVLYMDTPTILE